MASTVDQQYSKLLEILDSDSLSEIHLIPNLYFSISISLGSDPVELLSPIANLIGRFQKSHALKNNIPLLSDLCCIFADSPTFARDYQKLCRLISENIDSRQNHE